MKSYSYLCRWAKWQRVARNCTQYNTYMHAYLCGALEPYHLNKIYHCPCLPHGSLSMHAPFICTSTFRQQNTTATTIHLDRISTCTSWPQSIESTSKVRNYYGSLHLMHATQQDSIPMKYMHNALNTT